MSKSKDKIFLLSLKAILINSGGSCLLLRRSEASKNNGGKWDLPGGKIDKGETFDVALVREIKEETGLSNIRLSRPFETSLSELPDHRQVVYILMLVDVLSGSVHLSNEHDQFKWVSPSDLDAEDVVPQFRSALRHYAQYVDSTKPAEKKKSLEMITPADLKTYIEDFKKAEPAFEKLNDILAEVLKNAIKTKFPMATISGRVKKLVSFANKVVKKNKYANPVKDLTDLVGLRVTVHLSSEVASVESIIRDMFYIDEANSLDMLSRLGPEKFGYRSVHYVVEIKKDKPAGVKIPANLIGLKAEIQVRTIAQGAWAQIVHDRIYKGGVEISDYWKRESNRVAALLEAADEELQRLVEGISFYEKHNTCCTDSERETKMLALNREIMNYVPKDINLAIRHTRQAYDAKNWQEVIRIAEKFGVTNKPELMALHGSAMYKLATSDSKRKEALRKMEAAAELATEKSESNLFIADALAEQGSISALKHYQLAFNADSGNPEALIGFIQQMALAQRAAEAISIARPAIQKAILRCRELAAAKADLPRTIYRIAGFLQLLGTENAIESLATFALAVRQTRDPSELIRALSIASPLSAGETHRHDMESACRFLFAALRAKFPEEAIPDGAVSPTEKVIKNKGPFVIVAGGCDEHLMEKDIKKYSSLLQKAFSDFKGVVISGGTKEGISGWVGELASKSKGRIHSIGYLPLQLPTDGTATLDGRYAEIRHTDSQSFFSATEAIQVWLDLLVSGVKPSDVRLLGIGGGKISGLEYRIALALGAQVCLLSNSGREADRLIKEWPPKENDNLFVVPLDPMSVRAFLHMDNGDSKKLSPSNITHLAQRVHEDFLDQKRYSNSDPVMQPWAKLRKDIKNSNSSQISYLEDILASNGFGIASPAHVPPTKPNFKPEEIESMAEMEHGRWVVQRISEGWICGMKKDVDKKISPCIVGWQELEDGIQEYDREAVRLWPELLAGAGMEIYRLAQKKSTVVKRGKKKRK